MTQSQPIVRRDGIGPLSVCRTQYSLKVHTHTFFPVHVTKRLKQNKNNIAQVHIHKN